MQQYDVSMKSLLIRPGSRVAAELCGSPIVEWLNLELPQVRNPRVDLLGKRADGGIQQLDLQADNDDDLPQRFAEYYLGIRRIYRVQRHQNVLVYQTVLYIGNGPLTMPNRIADPRMQFQVDIIDVRDMAGDTLIASPEVGDNIIAILTRADVERVVRAVAAKLSAKPAEERKQLLENFLILASLRKVTPIVEKELKKMSLNLDIIKQSDILAPAYYEGVEKGRLEGEATGEVRGEAKVIRRLLESRFGPLPEWALNRINSASIDQLDRFTTQILDAGSIEQALAGD